MIVWVAAMLSLLSALQLPLCIVAVLEYSGAPRIGVGVSLFGLRGARRRALRRMRPPDSAKRPPWMEKTGWFTGALHGAKYLYAHRLLLRISVNGALGGSDAARVAVCWGAAQGLLEALSRCTDGRISGTLRPDFSAGASRGEIRVTYAVKAGTALNATLRTVGELISERVKTWTSIPSKA